MNRYFLTSILLLCLSACHSAVSQQDNEILAQNKKVAAINVKLGMSYLENGDKQRAKQKLLYALEKDPSLPEAWYSMAYYMEITQHKLEAKQNYLKALQLAPNRGDVHNNYGTFLCRSGEYRESIKHFLTATKDPQYLDLASAYENAGLCSLKIPDKQKAKQFFTMALEQDATRLTSIAALKELS